MNVEKPFGLTKVYFSEILKNYFIDLVLAWNENVSALCSSIYSESDHNK